MNGTNMPTNDLKMAISTLFATMNKGLNGVKIDILDALFFKCLLDNISSLSELLMTGHVFAD